MTYKYKTKPFDHQHKEFTEHGWDPVRGEFWEQGTGKTKPIIDSTAFLYEEKEIDGLVVIAPNGVHRNWVSDEMVVHMPDRVMERMKSHVWYSTDAKYHARAFEETLNHDGLASLVMSYNAVWTKRGRDAWKAFLKRRRCMYVLDESHRIGSPGAKWTQRIMGSKVAAPFRRVLTGTPIGGKPFRIYTQLKFLDPNVWKQYHISDYTVFKTFFGIWETVHLGENRSFPQCVAYKNLGILNHELLKLGSRLLKKDVLDLPPKVYSKRYFKLTPKQRALYTELAEQYEVEAELGALTAELAIVRLLRLQQIVCGYLPGSDDDKALVSIDGGNPRLDLVEEICEDLGHQAIIWARFQEDHRLISNLKMMQGNSVIVNGTVTGRPRDAAIDLFKSGGVQFLIASPSAIGMGYTLNMAKTCIYYSNSFHLIDRLQSEDRPHRIGQDEKVHYIDLCAEAVRADARIIETLRKGLHLSEVVQGDSFREWI
ncbi:hypothetical protein LCGC14_0599700 [marine sediment metagenome]|uniref:Helicase ATP-binding domain-containing protein n=1 Tax=marine sediment metagenome TaxID=412755 RepID=A0A0F9RB37_9ZZZZ